MRSGLDTGQLDRRVEEAHLSSLPKYSPRAAAGRSEESSGAYRPTQPTTLGRSGEAFREAPGGPEGFLNTRPTLIADPRQPDCPSPSILARETLRPSHAPLFSLLRIIRISWPLVALASSILALGVNRPRTHPRATRRLWCGPGRISPLRRSSPIFILT